MRVKAIAATKFCLKTVRNSFSSIKMPKLDLSGIFPPIVTPFDAEENVDFDKLKKNLEKWEKIGLKGYAVLGSNGEFPYLSEQEKINLVKLVRDNIAPEKLVIGGAGCESTRDTIDLCNKFASCGADAVLVITPSFYKGRMTPSALHSHYTKIADAVKLPVILYNVPGNTGVELPTETIVSLAKHPNIIGVKDSGGEIPKFYRLVEETKGLDFQVLAGSAGFLLPSLQAGCVGSICALANCLGQECVDLLNLYNAGLTKQEEARALQARLVLPNAAVTRKLGVAGLKHIMDKLGLFGGPVRSPLQPCTAAEIEEVETVFKNHGFL